MEQEEKFYNVNGIQLHALEQGDKNGKIILFLHGFPEDSIAWKKQLPFFAEKGFRAVAVDQRGYFLSSKPASINAYHLKNLVEDIRCLVDFLTKDKIILVAHDWGGGVAWSFAQQHPQLLEKMIILNMPHPAVLKKTLATNISQMMHSWYALFFQIPALPEFLLRRFDFRLLKRSMLQSSKKGTFTSNDFKAYKEAWQQPHSLTAMINWYRANKLTNQKTEEAIAVPVLILWGAKDAFLIQKMAGLSLKKCLNGKLVMLEDTTHWLHHEQPEKVNREILQFIQ